MFYGPANPMAIEGHDVVVVTDNYNKQYIIKLNEYCHKKNIGFIYGGAAGLYTYCFVDFGEKHTISDKDG